MCFTTHISLVPGHEFEFELAIELIYSQNLVLQMTSVTLAYTGENNYDSVKEFYDSNNVKLEGNIGATVNVSERTVTFEILHPTKFSTEFLGHNHTYLLYNNYVVKI